MADGMTRSGLLRGGLAWAAAGLGGAGLAGGPVQAADAMATRPIPSSGERVPVIGLGTWRGFDVGTAAADRAPLADVMRALFEAGGSVIDSSPMYGAAERVVGDLLPEAGGRERAFLATKVWTRGREAGLRQMERSVELMRARPVDLLQVHNLVDWRSHLATLRAWKAEGRVRYIGVTHYTSSAYSELEAVMRAERLDFVQLNYSADDRAAEARILPLAAERGIAVLINMPFGGGGLIRTLAGRPLPGIARDIGAGSWAQLLLKFVLAHPAVTCAIPGTSRPEHMRDNARAGFGPAPDPAWRERIASAVTGSETRRPRSG